jgi:hypothetical protein
VKFCEKNRNLKGIFCRRFLEIKKNRPKKQKKKGFEIEALLL